MNTAETPAWMMFLAVPLHAGSTFTLEAKTIFTPGKFKQKKYRLSHRPWRAFGLTAVIGELNLPATRNTP